MPIEPIDCHIESYRQPLLRSKGYQIEFVILKTSWPVVELAVDCNLVQGQCAGLEQSILGVVVGQRQICPISRSKPQFSKVPRDSAIRFIPVAVFRLTGEAGRIVELSERATRVTGVPFPMKAPE